MISTKGVAEGKSQFPSRLEPGIHDVKVVSVIGGVSTLKKTPYVEITFENAYGNHRETFYFAKTGKSQEISLEKIKHLATKMITEDELNAISAADVNEYAAKLNVALVNKNVRIKLSGEEEWSTKNGKMFVKRQFNFYPWAESAAVPFGQTKLKFNKNNLGDYKPLKSAAEASAEPGLGLDSPSAPQGSEDLPF